MLFLLLYSEIQSRFQMVKNKMANFAIWLSDKICVRIITIPILDQSSFQMVTAYDDLLFLSAFKVY
jgi:hypothetical protein